MFPDIYRILTQSCIVSVTDVPGGHLEGGVHDGSLSTGRGRWWESSLPPSPSRSPVLDFWWWLAPFRQETSHPLSLSLSPGWRAPLYHQTGDEPPSLSLTPGLESSLTSLVCVRLFVVLQYEQRDGGGDSGLSALSCTLAAMRYAILMHALDELPNIDSN